MKKVVFTCLASLALTFGVSASAMADIKVGIVDMKDAIQKTESDGVLKKLKTEAETRQTKLKDTEKKLLAFKQEIEESASVLSQDKLREKAAQYQQQVLEFQNQMQTYQQEMIEMETKLLGEVQKKMVTISSDIAKEKNLDLLLERSEGGVVYFQTSFDVTDELVKRYKGGK
jgi:Skp family chaperone for outer membrane proteins